MIVLLLVVAEALARMGGGEGWGGGGSRGGGGGGGVNFGGGGGGSDGDATWLIYLVIRLTIEHPSIGVPLLLVGGVVLVLRARERHSSGWHHGRRGEKWAPRPAVAPPTPTSGQDRGFSAVVFLDLVSLIHRRSLEASSSGSWESLAPFVAPAAQSALSAALKGGVQGAVVGNAQLVKIFRSGAHERAVVALSTSWRRGERSELATLVWTLQRPYGLQSGPPNRVTSLSCPSCASPVETDRDGACRNCGTSISRGEQSWQAVTVRVEGLRTAPGPVLAQHGGEEPSWSVPTVSSADLGRSWRSLLARCPGMTPQNFDERVRAVFLASQSAWSTGRLIAVRPFVTDSLYQRLRFLAEPYAAAGLRNEVRDLKVHRIEVVGAGQDAWFDTVTARVWAENVDVVVDSTGGVVGGDAKASRKYSELWTLIRTAGGKGKTGTDPAQCPSCAAPIEGIAETGVCGHCDAVVTTGDFDWVVSRIDQADAVAGAGG